MPALIVDRRWRPIKPSWSRDDFVCPSAVHLLSKPDALSGKAAGRHGPAIYGPSGDVKWDEADPTYSLEAVKRGG
jgi:hypothetical protein